VTPTQRLTDLVRGDERFMALLRAARACCPPDWAIGAGALRNLVWNHLTGRVNPARDVDVAYFDATRTVEEDTIEHCLRARCPDVSWDVKNQATVHTWYERRYGIPLQPYRSLDDAVGTFPETCTSIAVRLRDDDGLDVLAPCGLDDLFGMVLRRNRRQVTLQIFRRRLAEKRPDQLWPGVRVVDG
jgi:hypothetical protein